MIIGSHNTMSYMHPECIWMWPFRFMAQCQGKNLKEQFDFGTRYFDIRIVWNEKQKKYQFAHGLMTFKGDVWDALTEMNNLGEHVYCRVLKEREGYETEFKKFCMICKLKFQNITFFGGQNKKDWKLVYNFESSCPLQSIDKYSSCNYDTKLCTGWHLDDLFPRIYALFFNKYWRKKYQDTNCFLLQDFVGIH